MSFGSKSLAPPTAEEAQRIEQCKAIGCVPCLMQGRAMEDHCGPIEYHHILTAGLRAGHRYGYAAGGWHHRSVPLYRDSETRFGPSMREARDYRREFGSEQEILDWQDDKAGWPRVKIPSRAERRVKSKCTAAATQVKRDPVRLA